jgi:hypothetical protein
MVSCRKATTTASSRQLSGMELREAYKLDTISIKKIHLHNITESILPVVSLNRYKKNKKT